MSDDLIDKKKDNIASYYKQEEDILRLVLGMIIEERGALLHNDASKLQTISKEKEVLLESLINIRDQSSGALKELIHTISNGRHIHLSFDEFSDKYPTGDFSNIHLLRSILESVTIKIQEETLRNEYLIKNKVSITRDMIRKLQGDKSPQTYGPGGRLKTKQKKAKVTLINREV
jgi:flagellar biosynthesis/type III secretory pathway chaperone